MAKSSICQEVSVSKLLLARSCPRKFFWRYIEHRAAWRPWYLHAGSCVDDAINFGYREQALAGKIPPLSTIEDVANEAFKNQLGEVQFPSEVKPDAALGTCRSICGVFHKEFMPQVSVGLQDGKPMVQYKLTGFYKPLNTRYIGFVDLIEENNAIVDNKTSYNKRWPKSRVINNHQAIMYSAFRYQETSVWAPFRFDVVSALKTKTVSDSYAIFANPVVVENACKELRLVLDFIDEACYLYETQGNSILFYPNTDSAICSYRYCPYASLCTEVLGIAIKS
jgi:hypothetical protein